MRVFWSSLLHLCLHHKLFLLDWHLINSVLALHQIFKNVFSLLGFDLKFFPITWHSGCRALWAESSEFVSSSIPSWQILTAHAQPFRGARDLAFCLKVPLDSLLVWASSEGSGETARMRRLAWTFAARIGDKHQIRLTRSIWSWEMVVYWITMT